jgi:protein SCO1/2
MKSLLAPALLVFSSTAFGADPMPRVLDSVEVSERIGDSIPLGLPFTDATGRETQLSEFFGDDQPVVLILAYYQCPMLCNLVISGTAKALRGTGLTLGKDYRALTVSIDPTETPTLASSRKAGHLQALGAPTDEPAWGFMTGAEEQIRALARSVGFGYAYDEETKQYAHAAAVFILTPRGKISRYLYGINFSPRDLKLALLEAADGKVGTSLDRILLRCFKYDPALRKYGIYVWGILKGGALLVLAMLSALLAVLWRRELKQGTVR